MASKNDPKRAPVTAGSQIRSRPELQIEGKYSDIKIYHHEDEDELKSVRNYRRN